jgi:hypothetical protein
VQFSHLNFRHYLRLAFLRYPFGSYSKLLSRRTLDTFLVMSLTTPLCTKCNYKEATLAEKDEHTLQSCQKDWPFWDLQFCDRCGSPDHETGDAKKCPKKRPLMAECNKCGHEGHHQSKRCPISDTTNDKNVRQHTKSRYEAVMKKKEDDAEKASHKEQRPPGSLSGDRGLALRSQGAPFGSSNRGFLKPHPVPRKQGQLEVPNQRSLNSRRLPIGVFPCPILMSKTKKGVGEAQSGIGRLHECRSHGRRKETG